MSLAADFSHSYPESVQFSTEWCNVSQGVDLGLAVEEAFMIFEMGARSACPVRTGNLLSSISGGADSNGFTAEAGAEYAIYVEFGTWKMAAQPFFVEPFLVAVEFAVAGVMELFVEALLEAYSAAFDEINEHYNQEYERVIEEANMISGGDPEAAQESFDFLVEETAKLDETYMSCIDALDAQLDEQLNQGSFEFEIMI